MATQTTKFVIAAAGSTLAVYLGGSAYAMAVGAIDFATFVAAVGTPLGLIGGWVAKALAAPGTVQ